MDSGVSLGKVMQLTVPRCRQRQMQRELKCVVSPRIVASPAFDILFALLILTNAVFIGHLLACFVLGVPDVAPGG